MLKLMLNDNVFSVRKQEGNAKVHARVYLQLCVTNAQVWDQSIYLIVFYSPFIIIIIQISISDMNYFNDYNDF